MNSRSFGGILWAALGLTAACVLLVTAAPLVQQAPANKGLTPAERRGKAIYLRGESPSGKPMVAMLGDVDVPPSTMPCAGCHGLRGEGKTEGGVTAGT